MTRNDRPALGRFTARYKALVAERGTNFTRLSKATGYSHAHVSNAAKGGTVPSEKLVIALDEALTAGGKLLALWDEADSERTAHRRRTRGVDTAAVGGARSPQTEPARPEEADTDRREFGGLTVAQAVSLLADRVARADPTPLNLAQIGVAVQAASEARVSAPRAQLRARLQPEHLAVEALLDRRLSRPVRDELSVYAGLYCYYLGWLSHDGGDDSAAIAYSSMCDHHAHESRDPLLLGSAAELRTGLVPAAVSVDIAAKARQAPGCHPYVLPFLAAKEARGAAELGQPEQARAALSAMESSVWDGPPVPGPAVFDEEAAHAWLAIVLAELREGEAAEGHARSSLALLAGSDMPYHAAGTYRALAGSFMRRRRPDPEQAAFATEQAVALMAGRQSRRAIEKAERTWRQLASRWGELPAVRDLGELVVSARKALPAGGGT